ncbi:MAG: hypothetical protein EOO21_04550, partial [Comamonadaceae bacterium]
MAFGRNRSLLGRSKAQPASPRTPASAATDDWLHPIPASDVREGGESTWEAWQEESRRMDLAFADTQPSDVIPLSADAHAPPQVRRRGAHWGADDVLVVARRNNRVCPRPFLWSALYVLLEGDRIASVFTDVTERKDAEELQNVLNNEMSHRLKNTLA